MEKNQIIRTDVSSDNDPLERIIQYISQYIESENIRCSNLIRIFLWSMDILGKNSSIINGITLPMQRIKTDVGTRPEVPRSRKEEFESDEWIKNIQFSIFDILRLTESDKKTLKEYLLAQKRITARMENFFTGRLNAKCSYENLDKNLALFFIDKAVNTNDFFVLEKQSSRDDIIKLIVDFFTIDGTNFKFDEKKGMKSNLYFSFKKKDLIHKGIFLICEKNIQISIL